MKEQDINRINELYHKSKTPQGLTAAEKEEQARLRKAYINDFKKNLKSQLDRIDIKEKDGSITHVKDIPLKKNNGNS